MSITAIIPTTDYQDAFLAMLADLQENDPQNADFYAPARENFAAYVQTLLDEEAGRNLRPGYVPCTHRWLMNEAHEIVGVTRLRQRLDTPFLLNEVGHIGFDIAPAHRGKGYGHHALRVGLEEAAAHGISRALLYTDENNRACRAVIERAQGELEAILWSEFWQEKLCKYGIPLRPAEKRG